MRFNRRVSPETDVRLRVGVTGRAFALIVAASLSAFHSADAQRRQPVLTVTVIDSATQRPLADVQVLDLRTRRSTFTTATGRALVTFPDSAGALISFRSVGYQPLTRLVGPEYADSSLTISLVPLPQPLPGVETSGRAGTPGRGPADTLRLLELNGFYERRRSTSAPGSAFVTEEKLSRLTTLADTRHLTGRSLCVQNLYVDGMRVRVDRSFYSWLRPDRVAGIELYTHASEIPAMYNVTLPSGSTAICATLIWTK